jgi:hypothetical protein
MTARGIVKLTRCCTENSNPGVLDGIDLENDRRSQAKIIRRLPQLRQSASVFAQGCADFSSGSADRNSALLYLF